MGTTRQLASGKFEATHTRVKRVDHWSLYEPCFFTHSHGIEGQRSVYFDRCSYCNAEIPDFIELAFKLMSWSKDET